MREQNQSDISTIIYLGSYDYRSTKGAFDVFFYIPFHNNFLGIACVLLAFIANNLFVFIFHGCLHLSPKKSSFG